MHDLLENDNLLGSKTRKRNWGGGGEKAQKYFGGKYSSYVYTGIILLGRENYVFVQHF